MNQHWENLTIKVDGMSLRERGLTFAAVAFVLITLIKVLLFNPLLAEQKGLSAQVIQQQEKAKASQAQMEAALQAIKDAEKSPLRQRIQQARQQLADSDAYLQGLSTHLVPPEKIADLLEQVLNQNGHLQLVDLQTSPVVPLVEKEVVKPNKAATAPASAVVATPVSTTEAPDNQLFKHEVKIIVRGSYLDLLQYLTDLEQLPTQMFWGRAEMKVEKYPDVVLTLTLYTLSLDKTWLKI